MKRLQYLMPVFVLVAVAVMAGPVMADGGQGLPAVPEPASIVALAGLAVMGVVGWLWQGRRRRP